MWSYLAIPAPIKSFFATLKKKLVHHEQYQTPDRACLNTSKFSTTVFTDTQR